MFRFAKYYSEIDSRDGISSASGNYTFFVMWFLIFARMQK